MAHEALHLFSDDKLLLTMAASVNDARDLVRRTQELIEQSRIMLRELDDRQIP
jgi:20S proteasome alpha/beta subunit